jgi:hypothetical protein
MEDTIFIPDIILLLLVVVALVALQVFHQQMAGMVEIHIFTRIKMEIYY